MRRGQVAVDQSNRLWEEQENLRERRMEPLRKDMQAGLDSGPSKRLDFEDIKKRGRERVKSRT
jgi:antitoxin ParD1/3/4